MQNATVPTYRLQYDAKCHIPYMTDTLWCEMSRTPHAVHNIMRNDMVPTLRIRYDDLCHHLRHAALNHSPFMAYTIWCIISLSLKDNSHIYTYVKVPTRLMSWSLNAVYDMMTCAMVPTWHKRYDALCQGPYKAYTQWRLMSWILHVVYDIMTYGTVPTCRKQYDDLCHGSYMS